MGWQRAPFWHQKARGSSRAEGRIWAEGCAHPSTVTVLLRGQLMDCGPTPTPIASRENGATRVWRKQDPEPVRSQVSVNAFLTKPGLPAETEGLASCRQSEGKKDAASSFTRHTVILRRLWQDSRQLSLYWSDHHFQMLRFWEKPQERKLCYYKGSAFVKAHKRTH